MAAVISDSDKWSQAITHLIGPLDSVTDNGVEGGYVNDPDDPGGETKYGITKRSYPHLAIFSISKETAASIYQVDWYLTYSIDQLPPLTALKTLDVCVNIGSRHGVRLLQRAILWSHPPSTLTTDGVIGPRTITIASSVDDQTLANNLRQCVADYYHMLVAEHPVNRKFLAGWLRRAAS